MILNQSSKQNISFPPRNFTDSSILNGWLKYTWINDTQSLYQENNPQMRSNFTRCYSEQEILKTKATVIVPIGLRKITFNCFIICTFYIFLISDFPFFNIVKFSMEDCYIPVDVAVQHPMMHQSALFTIKKCVEYN